MDLQLTGTTAVVTGAVGGIGRATAVALAAEGVRVALLDRDVAELRATAEGCRDAVVHCAGISGPVGRGIEGTSLAERSAVFAVNTTAAFLVLREALPALRAATAVSVVLLASDSAFVASPGMAPYCASKAALVQFARDLSVDLAGTPIRANTVAPSIVGTPMSRDDLGAGAFDAPAFAVQSAGRSPPM